MNVLSKAPTNETIVLKIPAILQIIFSYCDTIELLTCYARINHWFHDEIVISGRSFPRHKSVFLEQDSNYFRSDRSEQSQISLFYGSLFVHFDHDEDESGEIANKRRQSHYEEKKLAAIHPFSSQLSRYDQQHYSRLLSVLSAIKHCEILTTETIRFSLRYDYFNTLNLGDYCLFPRLKSLTIGTIFPRDRKIWRMIWKNLLVLHSITFDHVVLCNQDIRVLANMPSLRYLQDIHCGCCEEDQMTLRSQEKMKIMTNLTSYSLSRKTLEYKDDEGNIHSEYALLRSIATLNRLQIVEMTLDDTIIDVSIGKLLSDIKVLQRLRIEVHYTILYEVLSCFQDNEHLSELCLHIDMFVNGDYPIDQNLDKIIQHLTSGLSLLTRLRQLCFNTYHFMEYDNNLYPSGYVFSIWGMLSPRLEILEIDFCTKDFALQDYLTFLERSADKRIFHIYVPPHTQIDNTQNPMVKVIQEMLQQKSEPTSSKLLKSTFRTFLQRSNNTLCLDEKEQLKKILEPKETSF